MKQKCYIDHNFFQIFPHHNRQPLIPHQIKAIKINKLIRFLISCCTYPRIKISRQIFKIKFHKNKFEIFNPKIYIEYGMRFRLKITRLSCDRSVRTSSTSV
ncbi:hypothetical protein M9487_001225 [Salmonella enterica]|nr:hypothetical protein [Salmonella enterica]EED5317285.1 hypothetical protein [Salmonella enterica subsp. enterica serovar Give]EBR6775923.1 hypothetical protein [Salmonella enterica]ECZ6334064.1 hypothetical protein [Salmonella enterica]EDY8126050.1 hypothetical protein [Salmonella enterica]